MHRVVGPRLRVWLILPVLVLAAATLHAETCQQQAAAKTAEFREQINQLLQTKDEGDLSFHGLGKCSIKALKLGLTLAAPGLTSDRMAKAVEAADCLRLKIKQLDTMCYCAQLGADMEQDLDPEALPDRMDQADAAYDRMQKQVDQDLKKGIKNPVIEKYVESANRYKSCFDKRSLNLLNDISAKIDAIEIAPGDDTIAGGPAANLPTLGGKSPTGNAPEPGATQPTANAPQQTASAPAVPATNAPPAGGPTQSAATPTASGSPQSGNCADLRNDIMAMDAQSNALSGYLGMRVELAGLYNKLCGTSPAQRTEYWYSSDGKQLGPVGAGDRPPNAAYAATQDIGEQCAASANPGMCALALGSTANCKKPPSDLSAACQVAGGYGDPDDSVAATGGDPLPPARLTIGGRAYVVPDRCAWALARANDGGPSNSVIRNCPEGLLAALGQAEGKNADLDPTAFLNGLGPLLQRGFAPPGTAPTGGFNARAAAACAQLEDHAQICRTRENNMGPYGQTVAGTTGQTGAFDDCYRMYSQFAAMCRMMVKMQPQIAKASLPKAPLPKPPAAPPAKPAPPVPPKVAAPAQPQMSPQCQQLVSNYVSAAQANNGPAALAGYNALKQAGGCGVLAKFDRPPPQSSGPSLDDPRFASRGGQGNTDSVFSQCDSSQAACDQRTRQLQAGVSPAAQAALVMNAIQIGLQLGTAMANGMAAAAPHGTGTNMNSIGNRPVTHSYGQGAPAYHPPPQQSSTITGTIGGH